MMIKTALLSTLVTLCATGCHKKHAEAIGAEPGPGSTTVIVVPGPTTVVPVQVPAPAAGTAPPANTTAAAPSPQAAPPAVVQAPTTQTAPGPTTVIVQQAPAQYAPPPQGSANGAPLNTAPQDGGMGHFDQVGDDQRGSGVDNP